MASEPEDEFEGEEGNTPEVATLPPPVPAAPVRPAAPVAGPRIGTTGGIVPTFESDKTPAITWSPDPAQRQQQVQTEITRRRLAATQQAHPFMPTTEQEALAAQPVPHEDRAFGAAAEDQFQYQQRQARAQAIGQRRDQIQQTRDANSKALADFYARGVKHYVDPATGLVVPMKDTAGGEQFHVADLGPSINPATGLPSLARRNAQGVIEHRPPPLKLNPADPNDPNLYADFSAHGIADSPKSMTIADAAASDDMKLRALGVRGLARKNTAIRRDATTKAINDKRQVDLGIDTAKNEAEQLNATLADPAKVRQMSPPDLAAAQARQAELAQSIGPHGTLIPGSPLHIQQQNSDLGLKVHQAMVARDAYADQEQVLRTQIASEGGDADTDPRMADNQARLTQYNSALTDATNQQARYTALIAPRIQAQALAGPEGAPTAAGVLRLQKQSADIAATLGDENVSNLDPAVVNRLTEQKKIVDARAVSQYAKLVPDDQKRITAAQAAAKPTSIGGAAARTAGTQLAGGLGAWGGAEAGAAAGAALGPIGAVVGGGLGAVVGSILANKAQEKILKTAAPDTYKELQDLQAKDAEDHPVTQFVAGLATNAALFRVEPLQAARGLAALSKIARGAVVSDTEKTAAKTLAMQSGFGAAIGAGTPLAEGRRPTVNDITQGAAQALLFGAPRFGGKGGGATPAEGQPAPTTPTNDAEARFEAAAKAADGGAPVAAAPTDVAPAPQPPTPIGAGLVQDASGAVRQPLASDINRNLGIGAPLKNAETSAEVIEKANTGKSAAESSQIFEAADRADAAQEATAQKAVDDIQEASGRPREEILATRNNPDGTPKNVQQWTDELQKETAYQRSPLTVDPERRAKELRADIAQIDREWDAHREIVAKNVPAAEQRAAVEADTLAKRNELQARRDAIETQLGEAERVRQSPQGAEALRGALTQEQAQAQESSRRLPTPDLESRRDAIEQQLIEAERVRQSNAGGAALRNDLAGGTPPEEPPAGTVAATPPEPVAPVDIGQRNPEVSTGNGVPTEREQAMLAEQQRLVDEHLAQSRAATTEEPTNAPTQQGADALPVLSAPENSEGVRSENAVDQGAAGEGQTEVAQPVSEAVKPTPPDAAPISADTPPPTPESVAGEPLSKGWHAFSPESGSLGIPRAEMPQVKSEARGALVNFLKARGITASSKMVMPDQLRPTQAEFSPQKVQDAREHSGSERPILISSDGHVVDGHHQWLANLDDTQTPMPVIKLNAPIDKVLAEMKEFPSAENAKGAAPEAAAPEAAPPATASLSDRTIDALLKAKKSTIDPRSTVGGGLTGPALAARNAYVQAHNAAIDLAVLAIKAGRKIADVTKMAIDRFKAKYPGASEDEMKQFAGEMRTYTAQQSPVQQSGPAPETTGIAHRVNEAAGIAAERGQGISAEASTVAGREKYTPEKAIAAVKEFENDPQKRVSEEAFQLAKAHKEALARVTNAAADANGVDSPEYRAARTAEENWVERVKPLQTAWNRSGVAQQGETEIDTGTFHGLARAVRDVTGRDLTPKEAKEAKDIAGGVKDATDAADTAQDKVMKSVGLPRKTTPDSIKAAEDVISGVKAGGEWSPVQAKALWHVAKANYLDKGTTDFNDIRSGLATDYGLSKDDIARGMASPKGVRPITDEMYAKMAERRRVINQAKQWVADSKYPGYQKFFRNIPNAFFNLATFGHGTVWTVTHAGNQYFLPKASGELFKDLGRSFKLMGVTDKGAYHERMMQDLVRDPNFITAKRAGLANDPFRYQDDYQNPGVVKTFKDIGLMGNRGFDGMKIFRQFRFNQEWDKMPASLKTPDGAKLLADSLNKATGITKASNLPNWMNTAFFAPKLEASRWAFLYGDPAKAAKTLLLDRKTASPEERHAAVRDVRQKLTMAGTYLGALALNQAVLSATDSDQKVNFTNPRAGDWLSFKGFGHNFGVVSPMVNSVRFLQNIAHDFWGERSKLEQVQGTRGSAAGTRAFEYARGKLSPFAGVALDAASQSDSVGRPLPYSSDPLSYRAKELGAKDRYSYGEYASKKLLPIPLEEAATEIWRSQGIPEDQIGKYLRAIAIGASAGGTGVRVTPQTPDYQPKGARGTPQSRSTEPVRLAAPR